jgi:twinkle protein
MLSAMAQGERVLIASMEMKPVSTVERMAKQAWGFERLTVDEARGFSQWTDDRLWIYDHLGSVHWEKLLGVFRYCCAELKMTHIVIDSLMRCGIADDDYKGQKQFMDALCTLKMDYPVHIHLVLHSRKLSDESQIPGKFDVKGSGTLTDLADNVVSVWRNKAKEAALQSPSHMRSAKDAAAIDGPDCLLCIDKQRHFEWEGKVALWYIPGCMQYVATDQEQSANLMMNSTATSVVDIEF